MESNYFQAKAVSTPTLRGGISGVLENPVETARKPSNTEQAVKSLESASARLDALVSELERRISLILMPWPAQAGQGEQHAAGCQLAEKLFSEETTLRVIAERIDSIISRVDL